MRAIAVTGRRFSGSTILCRMLDLVPGVVGVGETDWLMNGTMICTSCGKSCKYFNSKNFSNVSADRLYRRIANCFDTDVLITSDKRLHYLEQVTPPKTLDVVVVFKSPFAFAASDKRGHPRHRKSSGELLFPKMGIERSTKLFRKYYNKILQWDHPRSKVFVSLERLMIDHVVAMSKVCDALDLPEPGPIFSMAGTKHHFVLGNYDAMDSLHLGVDDRWVEELSDQQKARIARNKKAIRLYNKLLQYSCI